MAASEARQKPLRKQEHVFTAEVKAVIKSEMDRGARYKK